MILFGTLELKVQSQSNRQCGSSAMKMTTLHESLSACTKYTAISYKLIKPVAVQLGIHADSPRYPRNALPWPNLGFRAQPCFAIGLHRLGLSMKKLISIKKNIIIEEAKRYHVNNIETGRKIRSIWFKATKLSVCKQYAIRMIWIRNLHLKLYDK